MSVFKEQLLELKGVVCRRFQEQEFDYVAFIRCVGLSGCGKPEFEEIGRVSTAKLIEFLSS
jgi:hypothetical protein